MPGGRPKGSKTDTLWRDAVRVAVNARHKSGGKNIRRLAEALVNKGLEADVSALKEIGDRVDGKVPQALVGGDGGPLTVVVRKFSDA